MTDQQSPRPSLEEEFQDTCSSAEASHGIIISEAGRAAARAWFFAGAASVINIRSDEDCDRLRGEILDFARQRQ
jgi:hypothetical protein